MFSFDSNILELLFTLNKPIWNKKNNELCEHITYWLDVKFSHLSLGSGKLTVFHIFAQECLNLKSIKFFYINWNSLARALTWIYNILFLLNTKCTTKYSLEPIFKSDIDHWISHHRHFKSYLSNYKSDFDDWRSDHSNIKSYLSHYKSDLGHWRIDQGDLKSYLSCLSHYYSDIGHWRSDHSIFENYLSRYKIDFGH